MNDEIKEILHKLDYLVKNEMCWWENYTVFSPKDTKLLLDYITNLQHTNEYLGEVLHERDLELEKLKTKMKEQSLLLIDYQDMEQKLENYKSRVEKAVEILKHTNVDMPSTLLIETIDNGINILNGKGSDE